ncbi:glycosyltransferase family 2 protein [Klebsiella aerogenes]|uniref:glycosyltransferase family 2 protein n=1 Tax=Klebsiella aerogenes TaxID=548 RepID=UPI0035139F1B|nr:glycosyl transferase [Klebsiella aerogenes]
MNNSHYNAFLVVVYNKTIEQSETIKTLMKFSYDNAQLTIYNNGPRNIIISDAENQQFNNVFEKINIVNDLNNRPLSLVYNQFIEENEGAKSIILLDDDTEITSSFVDIIHSSKADLELPKIVSRETGRTYYPMSSGEVPETYGDLDPYNYFCVSIASGLIISRSLIREFYKNNLQLFDERYAFYGVDSSFFKRLKKLLNAGVCFDIKTSCYIRHSLSLTEEKFNDFRFKERLWDAAISTRRYPSIWQSYMFTKTFFLLFKYYKIDYFIILFTGFFRGKHPRCK